MRAYELPVKVTPEGELDIPPAFLRSLPRGEVVRLIVLVSEADQEEQDAWARMTADEFLAGYDEADAVYDKVS